MKLLHIDSSITGEASASRRLSAAIVETVTQSSPQTQVIRRDLASDPLPHLDGRSLAGMAQGATAEDSTIRAEAARDAQVLDEFLAADIVVIGAPMYNLGVSSQLKAWLDRRAVAGKTFRYTAAGPEGLAGGRTVIIASSRGGLYGPGTPQAVVDFQEPYLRSVFGLMGVTDVRFVRAEGLNLGPDQRQAAFDAALGSIGEAVALAA